MYHEERGEEMVRYIRFTHDLNIAIGQNIITVDTNDAMDCIINLSSVDKLHNCFDSHMGFINIPNKVINYLIVGIVVQWNIENVYKLFIDAL